MLHVVVLVLVTTGWKTEDHICVFEMKFTSLGSITKPVLLTSKQLPGMCVCMFIVCVVYVCVYFKIVVGLWCVLLVKHNTLTILA